MISHVCNVASGAKDTRLFAIDFRRAAFAAASSLERIDFVAVVGMNADFLRSFDSRLGGSGSSSDPGPILLLRPRRPPFFAGDMEDPLRCNTSLDVAGATFSLSFTVSMVCDEDIVNATVEREVGCSARVNKKVNTRAASPT
jgi:hypothetical protein